MLFARKNCVLKELKSKKNKEKKAPAPHRKEKTIKEKSQKTTHIYKGSRFAFRLHKKALLCNGNMLERLRQSIHYKPKYKDYETETFT